MYNPAAVVAAVGSELYVIYIEVPLVGFVKLLSKDQSPVRDAVHTPTQHHITHNTNNTDNGYQNSSYPTARGRQCLFPRWID